jgi:hypothetical protein
VVVVSAEPVIVAKPSKSVAEEEKVTAKPEPSNVIISTNDVNVTKNVEVYSQGEKVIGNNSMNINDLPAGTYLLKITNSPSKRITSK